MDHSTPHVEIQRTNSFSFHPSYWNPSMTHEQTTLHFILHIGILARQMDKLRHIHPSFWNPRKTDGQTTCHFNLHNSIHVRQMEKLCFILSSNWNIRNTDRRTNCVSFYPSFWNTSKIYGQIKNHFTPYIGIYARQTTFHFTPHIVV